MPNESTAIGTSRARSDPELHRLIYALAFGVFIFAEVYTTRTMFGIALVVAGVLLSVIYGQPKALEVIEESELAE
jgi:hypothetical protein